MPFPPRPHQHLVNSTATRRLAPLAGFCAFSSAIRLIVSSTAR